MLEEVRVAEKVAEFRASVIPKSGWDDLVKVYDELVALELESMIPFSTKVAVATKLADQKLDERSYKQWAEIVFPSGKSTTPWSMRNCTFSSLAVELQHAFGMEPVPAEEEAMAADLFGDDASEERSHADVEVYLDAFLDNAFGARIYQVFEAPTKAKGKELVTAKGTVYDLAVAFDTTAVAHGAFAHQRVGKHALAAVFSSVVCELSWIHNLAPSTELLQSTCDSSYQRFSKEMRITSR